MIKNFIGKNRGFTLVELMITLAILAIVAALAAPSFTGSIRRNERTSCTNQMVGVLQLARGEAIRQARPVTVTAPDGITGGITVYRDDNKNGNADDDEIIQVTTSCNGPAVAVATGDIEFSYSPNGQTSMANELEIEVCHDEETAETGRRIHLLVSGVLRSNTMTCS